MGLSNYASIKEYSEMVDLMLLTSVYTRSSNISAYNDDRVILVAISQVSGMASFIVWLLVQVPQIIENHLNRSVQGLSLFFVIFWICGDVSNFVGSVLNGTPFQMCIGVYHCIMGLVLGAQYWYYTNVYAHMIKIPDRLQESTNENAGFYDSKAGTRANRFGQRGGEDYSRLQNLHTHRSGRFGDKVLKTSLSTSAFIRSSDATPIAFDNKRSLEVPSTSLSTRKVISEILSVIRVALSSSLEKIISFEENSIPAWICSLSYVSSRPPQIIQNYRTRSTNGLSPYTFLLAMIGNLLYAISIVSSSCILFKKDIDAFNSMMSANMPYVVSSMITFFFDTILLLQCLYYDDSNKPTDLLDPDFLSNSLVFMQYGNGNTSDMNNPTYRHSKTWKENKKNKIVYENDSSLHFQTPAWYTNDHLVTGVNEDQDEEEDYFISNNRRRSHRGLSSHDETTSLLNAVNYTLTTPPSHYISRSILDKRNYVSSQQTIPNIVANSTSRNDSIKAVKSAVSVTSLNSVMFNEHGSNVQYNTSILNTSLIPSIVSNYSSISKKLSHDSKTPFLPSDFLSDNFYNRSELASVSSTNM
ncbi:uncharacterized protein AC631_03044 [Debaryomyces fabryi]|uniref:Uncharacterized protein n=1 Tax=Debaryomyces fabryi TaxID=58627 RepID=A0A0V1PYB4_9ASCO|nr:uncharacterized protein AC631_03044 [Debaryomyces fabryi]KSA01225.1 hypothetical protein AC631_03044 [Debaryomyces fabryi]CUM52775.1 unnamed protein product [Debaryomyces fabryi]